MRIAVLIYVETESTETYDSVVVEVCDGLRSAGHEVLLVGIHGDVPLLAARLQEFKPELLFNLMEMFGEDPFADVYVPALLEILGYRYTGSGPAEMHLCQDKGVAKKLLSYEGVLTPKFVVYDKQDEYKAGQQLSKPLFIKPLRMDASLGIDAASYIKDKRTMRSKVKRIHIEFGDSALVEEYIDGREFYVGVLGNRDPLVLPPIELDFSGLPEGQPRFMDRNAKFAEGTVEYEGTKSHVAVLDEALAKQIQDVALRAYKALNVRDYGRVDLRLSQDGKIYVIEVNPNCYLNRTGEFAIAAAAAGISYEELVDRIAKLASGRYAT